MSHFLKMAPLTLTDTEVKEEWMQVPAYYWAQNEHENVVIVEEAV